MPLPHRRIPATTLYTDTYNSEVLANALIHAMTIGRGQVDKTPPLVGSIPLRNHSEKAAINHASLRILYSDVSIGYCLLLQKNLLTMSDCSVADDMFDLDDAN